MVKAKKEKKEEVLGTSLPVYNSKGKEVETIELAKEIFDGKVNKGVLYHAVRSYNANQRQGTASTKTISEVSGGGKKPWAQKGTGRARAGSIRSPLWRGGGITFGPHPRDYHYKIPKKVKRLALVSALNSKWLEKNLIIIDSLSVDEPKTKKFKEILDALKLKGKTLFIVDMIDDKVARAASNLKEVKLKNCQDFSTADLLLSDKVVLSKAALNKLPERLKTK